MNIEGIHKLCAVHIALLLLLSRIGVLQTFIGNCVVDLYLVGPLVTLSIY